MCFSGFPFIVTQLLSKKVIKTKDSYYARVYICVFELILYGVLAL